MVYAGLRAGRFEPSDHHGQLVDQVGRDRLGQIDVGDRVGLPFAESDPSVDKTYLVHLPTAIASEAVTRPVRRR